MYKLTDNSLGEITFGSWEELKAFVNSPALVYGVEYADTSWEDMGESFSDHFPPYGLDQDGCVQIREAATGPAWKQEVGPSHFIDLGLGVDEVIYIWRCSYVPDTSI